MTELVIRFLTPLVCGYLVFVTLSNNFLLWPRPSALLSRPRWLLGCCCGAAVAASLLLIMHFSYGKSLQEIMVVAPPLGIIFLTLITGSVLAWLGYRSRCIEEVNTERTLLDAGNNAPDYWPSEANDLIEPWDSSSAKDVADPVANTTIEQSAYDEAFEAAYQNTVQAQNNKITDTSNNAEADSAAQQNTRPLGRAEQEFLQQAQKLAKQQYELRCEVEKNLRITRKALLKLEAEQHQEKAGKSEKEMLLENKLQEQIRNTTKAENRLLREFDRSGQLQSRLAVSKDLVTQAKAEVRTNMEARSNAILTARKSVNFAKRSLEARDRAEKKLENIKIQLEIQSQTTSKVIKALEIEKQTNRDQSNLLVSLQSEQDASGLHKIRNSKPSKPWLSRVTGGNSGKGRIVRKIAEHNAETTTAGNTKPFATEKVSDSHKTGKTSKA